MSEIKPIKRCIPSKCPYIGAYSLIWTLHRKTCKLIPDINTFYKQIISYLLSIYQIKKQQTKKYPF